MLGAAALCATSATLMVAAGTAPAAITTGSIDPASGFPFSYADDVQGFAVQQCQDDSGFCLETPRPDPSLPISGPGQLHEDGEGFWWLAEAVVPNAGTGIARFVKESAFDNDVISQDHQVAFSRIRFRFQGSRGRDLPCDASLRRGRDCRRPGSGRARHRPHQLHGGHRLHRPAVRGVPGALPAERVTSFLRWDPTVGPAAPDGYIGNPLVEHKVIGSPLGTNFVRLERLDPPGGLVVEPVGETDQFAVQGKLAGPPPPPAPHIGFNTRNLAFGDRQVGRRAARDVTYEPRHRGHDRRGARADRRGPADFVVATNTCSGQTLAAGPAAASRSASRRPTRVTSERR